MKGHYLNNQNVKRRIKDHGKQAGAEFIRALDEIVEHIIDVTCGQWDGGHKRISSSYIPKKFKL